MKANRNYLSMLNPAAVMRSVAAAMGKMSKKNSRMSSIPQFLGVGPKKGMMSYHRDIKKQKMSRYPRVHQGAKECARRRRQMGLDRIHTKAA